MKKNYTKKNVILGRQNKNFSKIENVFLMIVEIYVNFVAISYFSAQKCVTSLSAFKVIAIFSI